ncbi:hypothetical protein C8R44DRAFT_754169 [Mycena epipterygia]|nr:hypothetical protein C8R44DRAFT_754169 [Mycena epipterygia]
MVVNLYKVNTNTCGKPQGAPGALLLNVTGQAPEIAEEVEQDEEQRESRRAGSPETGVDSTKRTTTNQDLYIGTRAQWSDFERSKWVEEEITVSMHYSGPGHMKSKLSTQKRPFPTTAVRCTSVESTRIPKDDPVLAVSYFVIKLRGWLNFLESGGEEGNQDDVLGPVGGMSSPTSIF